MSETLPPGWTGNDGNHCTETAGMRLCVWSKPARHEDCFGLESYRWRLVLPTILTPVGYPMVLEGPECGDGSAEIARADGLAAVEAFARKLLEQTAQLRAKEQQ